MKFLSRATFFAFAVCAFTAVISPEIASAQNLSVSKASKSQCSAASDVVVAIDGIAQRLKVGDLVCVLSESGAEWCEYAQVAASSTHTCPNGTTVTCSMDCNKCKTGTGVVADCHSCCAAYHPDPNGNRNCISNYCA